MEMGQNEGNSELTVSDSEHNVNRRGQTVIDGFDGM
jgi:hypothetical protein